MTAAAKTHSRRVCPVWVGYLLASPVRTLLHNPQKILGPHVRSGMHVMDVGSAMGFFSLPLARLVGASGRVICVDLQAKMLEALVRRARRAQLVDRIETRVCDADSLRVDDLAGKMDFVLAFAVVHEVDNAGRFFSEVQSVLKPHGRVLFGEPRGHVSERAFQESLSIAVQSGLTEVDTLKIARTHAVVLEGT
jgi:ubiquinone/menaquinone biosynthesis C-methylase UbiE